MDFLPEIPLAQWIESGLTFLTDRLTFITRPVAGALETGIDNLVSAMLWPPPWVLVLLVGGLAFWVSTRRTALLAVIGLTLLWNLGLWPATIETVSLVLVATLISVSLGLPLGILTALYLGVRRVMMPVLDFMQTMPAFVYLIPAIPFFGLGPVSAIFSTVIFAMPPAIRLTYLGINQVPTELIEAADAFGSSKTQKLIKLQLPMAKPTIMAGVNQTIMLSLSMVVIAAMIGAGGLGGEVWRAIQRFEPGKGFVAGLGVVIIAMIFDRITQSFGAKRHQPD